MANTEKLLPSSKGNFYLRLEFEECVPIQENDPSNDFFMMSIIFESGLKYELEVWTFKYLLTEVKDDLEKDYDRKLTLAGKYLKPPDLFIEKMDRELIESIVLHMIENDELLETWKVT